MTNAGHQDNDDDTAELQEPRDSRERHDPQDLRGVRVLVVDDSEDAADSMAFLLEGFGAVPAVATDGCSALEILGRWRPSVVLLDLGMPEMDGYDVARAVRARSELQDVALIALTGHGRQIDRERSREAGFAHHVMKPANVEELRRAILGTLSARDRRATEWPGGGPDPLLD